MNSTNTNHGALGPAGEVVAAEDVDEHRDQGQDQIMHRKIMKRVQNAPSRGNEHEPEASGMGISLGGAVRSGI